MFRNILTGLLLTATAAFGQSGPISDWDQDGEVTYHDRGLFFDDFFDGDIACDLDLDTDLDLDDIQDFIDDWNSEILTFTLEGWSQRDPDDPVDFGTTIEVTVTHIEGEDDLNVFGDVDVNDTGKFTGNFQFNIDADDCHKATFSSGGVGRYCEIELELTTTDGTNCITASQGTGGGYVYAYTLTSPTSCDQALSVGAGFTGVTGFGANDQLNFGFTARSNYTTGPGVMSIWPDAGGTCGMQADILPPSVYYKREHTSGPPDNLVWYTLDALGNVVTVIYMAVEEVFTLDCDDNEVDAGGGEADANLDGTVNGIDVGYYTLLYNNGNLSADLNADGNVNGVDMGIFLSEYSALVCN